MPMCTGDHTMSDDLQSLLNRIEQEGICKAKEEAEQIVAKAKQEAAQIVADAQQQASTLRETAEQDALAFAERSKETLRQAARDVQLSIEQSISRLLERVLAGQVDATLTKSDLTAKLVAEVVATYAKSGKVEISAPAELLETLRAQLTQQAEVTVVTDETFGTGFKVRLAGGRIEHDFSGEAVTAALSRLLRPQLAELLK